jgi:hypothetical protein
LTLDGPVTGGALEEHFTNNDVIRLVSGATVAGTVGAGKTLEIAGEVDIDSDGLVIESGGRVNILETGVLDATTGEIELVPGGALAIDGDLILAWLIAEEVLADGIPAGVSFGPNGAIDLAADGTDDHVDYLFSKGVPGVVSSAIIQLGGAKPAIPNWVGGRRLILSAANVNTTSDVELSGKGVLVVRDTLNLNWSADGIYPHTLKSTGSGGIVIAQNGTLALNDSVLPTAISIKVNGALTTNGAITTLAIPANVDLSAATLIPAGTGFSTFTFGPRAVNIGNIALINGIPLTIAGEANGSSSAIVNLNVKNIVNLAGAAAQLNLPAGITAVDRIIPSSTQVLNIGGGAHTTLRPLTISGTGTVQLVSPDLVLNGRIELTTTTVLGLAANRNLGSDNDAQLAQLAQIIGGRVNAGGLHFDLTGGTYYTALTTTGDLRISGTVTFGAYGAPAEEIQARSLYALDGAGTINGPSRIVLNGDLIVSDTITFNNLGGLTLTAAAAGSTQNTIANGQSIIVGPSGWISAGALRLNQGTYTAVGQVTIDANTGTITTGIAQNDGLIIAATLGDTVNNITLFAAAASASATFTATAGTGGVPVALSGTGITIPSDTGASGAIFEVSGTSTTVGVVTVKGTGKITLGAAATKGSLVLNNGAQLASDVDSYTALNTDYGTAAVYDTLGKLWAVGTGAIVTITTVSNDVDGVFTGSTDKQ